MKRNRSFIAVVACASLLGSGACKRSGRDTQGDPPEVDNSVVQHSDISAKPPAGCGGAVNSIHYGDAYKTLREAEDYKPGTRAYYVQDFDDNRNEYLLAGISSKAREKWLGGHCASEKDKRCFVPIFDEISAAAKRTLPKYRPRGYTHHDDDDLIRDVVKRQIPDATVLESGVSSPGWEIEKLSNGIPSVRYKYCMAWVKSASLDDGYCRIAYINVVQDYAGGGNFGDSRGNYIKTEPAGCK